MNTIRICTLILVSTWLAGGVAAAQSSTPDPRWLPWLGCWQPTQTEEADSARATGSSVVCVVPTSSPATVEIVSVADGRATSGERIQTGGPQRARQDEGCTGWDRAEWSVDGRRVFRTTEHTCPGGIQRQSSGLMAMLPSGEWISAQGVSVGGEPDVRVIRYRPAPQPAALPAAAARALSGRGLAVDAARTAAAAAPNTRDIAEASRQLGPDVTGAWLIERGQEFDVDARRLEELADAGVPAQVIDLMVALSYPDVFAIDREDQEGEFRPDELGTGTRPRRRSVHDPWGYYPGYGWGHYPGYGYYGRYYGRPVVVVRGPSRAGGRAVKGRGYTRGASDGSANNGSSPGASTSRSGSGSSRDEGRSRSGSGSGSTRTAKPRSGGS